MKKVTAAASLVGLTLLGISWLAEANHNTPVSSPKLVYNPAAKVYQLHGPTQFADQTLEQKMLAIQAINRHQGQLAAEAQVVKH